MSNGLCGPSNALQSFQKHSTADRTLQQDRLVSRPLPSQGFRSSPGPNATPLDPEFEAFQAGQLPIPLTRIELQTFKQDPRLAPAPQQLHQADASAWATEFQQLGISGPPLKSQQKYPQQTQPRGWMGGFADHQNQATRSLPSHQYSGIMAPLPGEASQIDNFQHREKEFYDEAFAHAFDEAAKLEAESERELQQQSTEEELEAESKRELQQQNTEEETEEENVVERLGADTIPDTRTNEISKQDNPEELARTAGQLLDRVKDNQSMKFKNSQFLLLMRQLRDGDVVLKGDRMVARQS